MSPLEKEIFSYYIIYYQVLILNLYIMTPVKKFLVPPLNTALEVTIGDVNQRIHAYPHYKCKTRPKT